MTPNNKHRQKSSVKTTNICPACLSEVDNIWTSAWYAMRGYTLSKTVCVRASVGNFLTLVLCTWNAAGLFCESMDKYANKIKLMGSLLSKCTVCGVQETHDDGDSASNLLFGLHREAFKFFASPMGSGAGGVLLAIRLS